MTHLWRSTLASLCAVLAGSLGGGCAAGPAIGRGGPVYAIRVTAVNGNQTAARGPRLFPACVLQVGDQVVRVWLADPSRPSDYSPVVLRADAEALKHGILVERSWSEAVVHDVTDGELASGAAVVYVPGTRRFTTVELGFEPVSPPALKLTAPKSAVPVARVSGSEPPR
jgi:hypothetical protein